MTVHLQTDLTWKWMGCIKKVWEWNNLLNVFGICLKYEEAKKKSTFFSMHEMVIWSLFQFMNC